MASYSDDFSGTLGSWTSDSGTWAITSGTLRQTTAGGSYRKLRYSSAMDTNDYYSQATAVSDSGTIGSGVFVRGANSATVTYYAYTFFGGDSSYVVEITAGAETILATGSAYTSGASIVARLQATGTALTGTRGGAADISTNDGSLTAGAAGCMSFDGLNGASANLDLWSAADLVSPLMYPELIQTFRQDRHGWPGLAR